MISFKAKTIAMGIGLGLMALPTASYAATILIPTTGSPDTYVQDSDGCTGGCGVNTNNVVSIYATTTADVYEINLTLATGWNFQNDPTGNGHQATFLFSDTSSTLTISNITSDTTFTQTTTPTSDSPYTFPSTGYGVSNSGGNHTGTYVSFDVTTTDATLAAFVATLQSATGGSDTPFFVADVSNVNQAATGSIDFGLSTATTPLPATWTMMLIGLLSFGFVAYRSQKQNTSFTVA